MGLVDSSEEFGSGNGDGIGVKQKYFRMGEETTGEEEGNGEIDDFSARNRIRESRRYVLICAVFASLNSVLLGYDVGAMSGCIIFIQKDLHISEIQQEILVGCLSFVSLLGGLTAGRTSDAIGRKWTIALAASIFQFGSIIMTFASSFSILMLGRLLAGIGIGFGIMIAPVYIAEISPAGARGSLTSFPEIFINVGILLGYISNYVFSGLPGWINWRVMLAVGILPSVFLGFALVFIPESPRWLVMKKRVKEANSVLVKITGSEKEAEEKLSEIQETVGSTPDQSGQAVWLKLSKPSKVLKRMLVTGLGIHFFQQITGIDATVYYSPKILSSTGIKSDNKLLVATVAMGFTKTVFVIPAVFLIDRIGRKPLVYISTIGMTFCLFSLAISLHLLDRNLVPQNVGIGVAITMVCGNVAFFSVGMGPMPGVLCSEIFPLTVRAQAAALGIVFNRVSSGLVAMSFLSICNVLSVSGAFFMFGVLSAVSVVFMFKFVPETKGKSLEQIAELFGGNSEGEEIELGDVKYQRIINQ